MRGFRLRITSETTIAIRRVGTTVGEAGGVETKVVTTTTGQTIEEDTVVVGAMRETGAMIIEGDTMRVGVTREMGVIGIHVAHLPTRKIHLPVLNDDITIELLFNARD